MKSLETNFILNVDSYKNGHANFIDSDIDGADGNVIPRKPSKHTSHVVAMGIDIFVQQYVDIVITMDDIDEAEEEFDEHSGGDEFDRERWEYIVTNYGGKLPIRIRAIPEGTVVPVGCPLVRVSSTDKKCQFLVSYIETQLQRGVAFPSTVASISRGIKKVLAETMMRHAGHKNVDFHLHNFGDRGASSRETAILAGVAHAVLFNGSDAISANREIKHWYRTKKAYLSSVEATEHSATCSNSDAANRDDFNMALKGVTRWGKKVERFVKTGKGIPVISLVIDTYDAVRFTREYIGRRLKKMIQSIGAMGGRLVLRPDSGNPETMPIEIIEILMEEFGYTVNEQGYKVLPPFIGVIQGDGINEDSIHKILSNLEEKKISLENLVFGMGGKLVHPEGGRDKYSFAQKTTAQLRNGVWEDLFKDPITDTSKRSLRGRVTTFQCTNTGKIIAERVELAEVNPFLRDMMVDKFVDGVVMNLDNFDDIRARANVGI